MNTRALAHLVGAPGVALHPSTVEAGDVTVLRRDPACFHGDASPFTLALESTDPTALIEPVGALAHQLDLDRSIVIVGTDHVFIPAHESTPVRYQYLMYRRADFTHDEYLARYETIHSRFGLRTQNVEGYTQLHVDLDASVDLAARCGIRGEPCDSMSELHLRSVEHFLEGIIADPTVGQEATEDEERFVDRQRSFGFAHRVV